MSNANPSLSTVMKCGVFTNSKGRVVFVHDKPIPPLQWVEYDRMHNALNLVFECGRVQESGIELDHKIKSHLVCCKTITLSLIQDKAVVSSLSFPFVVKDY